MGLVKLGANALLLSGNNTYAGSTTVAAGILTLSGSVTSAGNTNLLGGQLDINNPNALGSGTLTITGGSLYNTSGGSITLATNNAQAWNGDFTLGQQPVEPGHGFGDLGRQPAGHRGGEFTDRRRQHQTAAMA